MQSEVAVAVAVAVAAAAAAVVVVVVCCSCLLFLLFCWSFLPPSAKAGQATPKRPAVLWGN